MTVQINELVIRARIDSRMQPGRTGTARPETARLKRKKITIENTIVAKKNARER